MVVAWDFDFHQLSRNYTDTTLEQIQAGTVLYSHLGCGCFSTHAGKTPGDMYTIALPDADCPDFRYLDHHVDQPVLLLTRSDQEFNIVARPGYGMSTFSIPVPVWQQYFGTGLDSAMSGLLDFKRGVIPISADIANDLRKLADRLSGYAHHRSDTTARIAPVQKFESRLLEVLARLLPPDKSDKQELHAIARQRLLKQALGFIEDKAHECLNVKDFADAVHTSERTLERVFNRELGISPKKYLNGQRLYGVHRQLWQSIPGEVSVGQVANAWGFWHMGQFAKDYHRRFGELPSDTLNRPSMNR